MSSHHVTAHRHSPASSNLIGRFDLHYRATGYQASHCSGTKHAGYQQSCLTPRATVRRDGAFHWFPALRPTSAEDQCSGIKTTQSLSFPNVANIGKFKKNQKILRTALMEDLRVIPEKFVKILDALWCILETSVIDFYIVFYDTSLHFFLL